MSNRHWYCADKDGTATLYADKDDAEQSAKLASEDWPRNAPYRAVHLVDAAEGGRALNEGLGVWWINERN